MSWSNIVIFKQDLDIGDVDVYGSGYVSIDIY